MILLGVGGEFGVFPESRRWQVVVERRRIAREGVTYVGFYEARVLFGGTAF